MDYTSLLAYEIHIEILLWMDVTSIIRYLSVCKQYNVYTKDDILWKRKFLLEYPEDIKDKDTYLSEMIARHKKIIYLITVPKDIKAGFDGGVKHVYVSMNYYQALGFYAAYTIGELVNKYMYINRYINNDIDIQEGIKSEHYDVPFYRDIIMFSYDKVLKSKSVVTKRYTIELSFDDAKMVIQYNTKQVIQGILLYYKITNQPYHNHITFIWDKEDNQEIHLK